MTMTATGMRTMTATESGASFPEVSALFYKTNHREQQHLFVHSNTRIYTHTQTDMGGNVDEGWRIQYDAHNRTEQCPTHTLVSSYIPCLYS